MSQEQLELYIIDVIAVATGKTAYAARCYAGTLRVGDELTVAVDPEGAPHTVNAHCSAIYLTPELEVQELETSFAGEVTLDGVDLNPIEKGWMLRQA